MTARSLLVTIDTEVDKSPDWRISDPARYRSVLEGVPKILSPLFDRHGVKPTYLLSPEVIEQPECAATLRTLGGRAELGTHLHSEFIEPERRLHAGNMAGTAADALQRQDSRAVESAKLANLTRMFHEVFGHAPTSFRAGRFGMGPHTLEILAGLGYRVDSSVTPGLCWNYAEGLVDYRSWTPGARSIATPAGAILELPLSILPGSASARWVRDWPAVPRRLASRALGWRGSYQWLRPSWCSAAELIRYVQRSSEVFLNLMFHSMEIIPGASPYAQTQSDVDRIINAMDALFAYCGGQGIQFRGLTEVADHV
jgi:hypothetical protein